MKTQIYFTLLLAILLSCKSNSQQTKDIVVNEPTQEKQEEQVEHIFEIVKSADEWQKELSEMEFYVIREKGTERAFTGDLLENKTGGTYTCRACDLSLFSSNSKFKSGIGWPSFYKPLNDKCIVEDTDYDLGYARTEIICSRCGGHLGHVFNDGPKPTGLRYCVNSVSLDFEESK